MRRSTEPGRHLWRSPGFQQLADLERTVALYLLTGPQTNRIGLYPVSMAHMTEDLQRPKPVLLASVAKVLDATTWPMCERKVLFIPTWWFWFPPENERVFRKALADFPAVTQSVLRERFLNYRRFLPEAWHHILDAVAAGVPAAKKARIIDGPTDDELKASATGGLFEDVGAKRIAADQNVLQQQIVALWNETVDTHAPGRIPKVKQLNRPALVKKIGERWKTFPRLDLFKQAFVEAATSPWCRGESQSGSYVGWVIDLPWLVHSDTRMQRFVDRAGMRAQDGGTYRVANCRHTPPCKTPIECTSRLLMEK